ncbi:hypothetical protein B0H13DRAFT_2303536 [Mycena leptocephala]|nr:hypothetical protein B0H13DRAFT_2303536 [Mycena leptocephala]
MEMDPSRKLDTLAEIIKYHLEKDGRLAVSINADSSVVFPSSTLGENPIPISPDKLLVYAAWPSYNEQILTVLQLYGIARGNMVTLNGLMTIADRKNAVE